MRQHLGMIWILILIVMVTGCTKDAQTPSETPEAASVQSIPEETESSNDAGQSEELSVRFGAEGEPFVLHLYDNSTADAIAHHVGTTDWQLPIYHFDDFENWEVMQYYDIPDRYEIPSDPERVTEEHAGTVYYSEPNRIVLFYQDAKIDGEYTPVGYFDYSEDFVNAVKNNPVVDGWSNKLVLISADGE